MRTCAANCVCAAFAASGVKWMKDIQPLPIQLKMNVFKLFTSTQKTNEDEKPSRSDDMDGSSCGVGYFSAHNFEDKSRFMENCGNMSCAQCSA